MLHLSGWNFGSVEDTLRRISVPVWLSVRIMDVGGHEGKEKGDGEELRKCILMLTDNLGQYF